MTRFAELLARSCFSFLDGASHPDELVTRSQVLGHTAMAMCDRDGLYGSVRMHQAAVELEHPVVVGAELTLERSNGAVRSRGLLQAGQPYAEHPFASVALLVEDADGYAAMCRLLTRAHADHEKGEAGITVEDIANDSRGLFALLPLDPCEPLGDDDIAILRQAFGERSAIATWRHLDSYDAARIALAMQMSERHALPIVASNRPRYHHRARKPLADVVSCIRLGTTLDEAGMQLSPNAEAELKSSRAMLRLFAGHPEWVTKSADIAERCSFRLDMLRYHFPCEYGDAQLSPDANLRQAVERGLVDRYGSEIPDDVRRQIEKELALIAELEVAPYFLSVQQIVDIARERGILCQGRGSAANSAVCFVLGITAVDPVRSALLFERFMSTARREPPDIDVDFEHERREEVIQEIYLRYGRDRAAMVSEIICFRGKSSLREVGKVFGLSADQLDRLSSIASSFSSDPEVTGNALEKRGLDSKSSGLAQVVALASQLSGFPRHLSIHVGGFVLSSEPLYRVAPVEPARMEGRTVIPWDKDDLEALGFFKVDVLGLGMLTAVRKALELVHRRSGQEPDSFDPIDALAAIPAEDPAVYDAVCQADTVGVFQIESRAQMAMLPILRPRNFYDLVVEVGIVRPGPIQGKMVHPYLRRRTGDEEVTYPHPSLEPVLERTLGVPLFQEQVMQIAIVGAGYDPGEADQLRRDMAAWRKNGRLLRHRDKLLGGFAKNGVSEAFGERLFQQIQGFGEYGFPECVVGETLVLDASTGRRVAIKDIATGRERVTQTIACDAHMRLRKRRIEQARPSGRKKVYRLRTSLGRELIATASHPLLTVGGWTQLGKLSVGDHVATARRLTLGERRWKRHEIIVLADLVAEGNLCHPTTFYFYSTDELHRDEYVRMVERFPNTSTTVARHRACFSIHVRRADKKKPCGALQWAQDLGLRGVGAHDKRLPDVVFELRAKDISLLLARLWEGDGSLSHSRHASYDTVSRELAEQIQHLLLRLDIVSRLYERTRNYRERLVTSYVVTITGARNLSRFYQHVARQFLNLRKRLMARGLAKAPQAGRMTRDIVPAEVRLIIRDARAMRQQSWIEIAHATGLSMKEVQSRGTAKIGLQRRVVEQVGQHLRSRLLTDLGTSDLYWERIVSIEPVGTRETYDLTIEGDANFLANDFVVHNSHSASFALIVYASAWLKVHHAAAFACALVNSQPMGFYSPASLVRDAQKHGVEARPVRVEHSDWDCTLEPPGPSSEPQAIRLGLRLVRGLSRTAADNIVAARRERPFRDLDDLLRRASVPKDELEVLAEGGAFEGLTGCRREALWQLRAPRQDDGLFEEQRIERDEPAGLRPVTAREQLSLDYGTTGISLHDHPMRHVRKQLSRRKVLFARDQSTWKKNQQVTVAGVVLTRQRPMTAKGVVFVTLEDETGTINLVLYAHVFDQYELVARHAGMMLARGKVDRRGDVVHVQARYLERLDMPADPGAAAKNLAIRSRDFH